MRCIWQVRPSSSDRMSAHEEGANNIIVFVTYEEAECPRTRSTLTVTIRLLDKRLLDDEAYLAFQAFLWSLSRLRRFGSVQMHPCDGGQ